MTNDGLRAPRSLGDLQLAIMRVLWTRAEATAAEVHQDLLEERGLAPTTIATMLRKMEDRGLVEHRSAGRQFVYSPLLAETEVNRSLVGELVRRLFDGDPRALVSHLLAEGKIDLSELEQLRREVDQAERRRDLP